ncbi:MAG: hypothetical protein JNN01_22300 [Opitutaceae bacterium]|nr:hypothetical protein [Opitutaceae bacterium]
MKSLRIFALILGGLLLALLLLVGVALLPAVQTWAARKALSGQPGLTLEVDRVSAGLSQAELKGVQLVQDGSLITAERVVASYSVWDYLAGHGIQVDQAEVQGLVVDLRQAKPSPSAPAAATPATPFQGVFALLRLPIDLTVNRVRAESRVLLPENRTAVVTVDGQSIAAGQTGTLSWKVDFNDSTPGAALRQAVVQGQGKVSVTADNRIDRIELQTSATPQGPQMSGETLRFDLTAAQPAAGGAESFQARLGLVRTTGVESLFTADLSFDVATRRFKGDWNLSAAAGQLRAILKDFGLPEFSATGKGDLAFATDSGEAAATGTLQARVPDLRALSPQLPSIGAVDAQGEFAARFARDVTHLDRFALAIREVGGRTLAEVTALQPIAFDLTTQRATLSRPGDAVARVSAHALPLAWAQTWVAPRRIESGDLSLTLEVKASADGNQFSVQAVEPLAVRQLTLRDGETVLLQQASFTVRPTLSYEPSGLTFDLSQLQLGLSATETITGALGGKVRLATATAPLSLTFSTELKGKLGQSLKPWLPLDPGPVEFAVTAQGSQQGDRLDVAKASLQLNGDANVSRLGFDLLQPLQVGLRDGSVASARPADPLARVTLGELPLAWAGPWVKDLTLAGAVSGGVVEVALRSRQDLTAVTTTALSLKGVSLSQGGKPLVQSLDTSADFTVTLKGDLLTYDLRRLELKEASATPVSLRAAGSIQTGKTLTASSTGNLALDLPSLLRQPALASYAAMNRGAVTLDFTASTGAAHQAKVTLAARDLVATAGNSALGQVETTLELQLDAEGRGKVVAPVRVTAPNRVSDLKLEASFNRTATSLGIQGSLTGDQVILDDLQVFARVVPGSSSAAPAPAASPASAPIGSRPVAPTSAPPPVRDTQPAWKGVAGTFDVKLNRVVYGKDYPVQGLQGRLLVTADRLAVEGFKGRLKENPFSVTALVAFDAKRPQPYALTGKAQVEKLDIGEILRAANPSEKPALETQATVLANLGGQGVNLNQLLQNATGTFDLSGGKGVLRALGRKGQMVGAASLLLGALGAKQGSNTTMAVADLASVLNELSFTQFKIRVERGADLNLNVPTLEFLSPTARLTGSGRITHQAGVPIENQPLQFDLKLAGKDSLAFLLNRAGVLSGEKDNQEYFLMNQAISLGGTPAKPDASAFWRLLGQAALGGLLR